MTEIKGKAPQEPTKEINKTAETKPKGLNGLSGENVEIKAKQLGKKIKAMMNRGVDSLSILKNISKRREATSEKTTEETQEKTPKKSRITEGWKKTSKGAKEIIGRFKASDKTKALIDENRKKQLNSPPRNLLPQQKKNLKTMKKP